MDFRKSFHPERDMEMSLYEYKSGFNAFEFMFISFFPVKKIFWYQRLTTWLSKECLKPGKLTGELKKVSGVSL